MLGLGACLLLGFVGTVSAFSIGNVYKYSYETTVFMNEQCGLNVDHPQLVGKRLKADVHLSTVWKNQQNPLEKLMKIQILNPKVLVPKQSSLVEHFSDLDNLPSAASYVLWAEGTPTRIWEDSKEHFSLRNLKKGIASLLQFRRKDETTKELDVSGECDVIYTVKGSTVLRRKGNCVHPKFDRSLSQLHGVRSASTLYQHTAKCDWNTEEPNKLTKCSVDEHVKMFSNAWHKPSLCVNTKSHLIFEGEEKDKNKYDNKELEAFMDDLKKETGGDLQEGNIFSDLVFNEETPKKRQLKSSVTKLQDNLRTEKLAKLKSAVAFYKLLPAFRVASKDEILELLNNKNWENIQPQILDLVSACATVNCLGAALEYFKDETKYCPKFERFVISLSILPKPTTSIIKELKSFIEKRKDETRIKASLLATLGTLLKTYAENYEVADPKTVEDTRMFLEDGLKNCDKDSQSCRIDFLRGLRNAARPRSAKLFLEIAGSGGNEALEALKGLRNIPDRLLPSETQNKLLDIFYKIENVHQDRSTRALAVELILRQRPGPKVLKSLLVSLQDQKDQESSTFLASKIMHMASLDEELRASILRLLPEKDVSYYLSLAQVGQSSLFTKPMLAVQGTNLTYGIEMEMLEGGILKRSVFDVSFENNAGGSSLLSVGIFAEGLGALAGGDSSEDPKASPTAGMELGFLGSALRSYVFFKSTSELMSHAWSGTASELTPVMQCITTFSDDERVSVLSNGMVVRGQLRGVISLDTSASVQISLWNRNSQSLVANRAALLVRGSITVDAGFAVTQGTIQFKGESSVDFNTDINFYESPFTICLEMDHPDAKILFDVYRSVSLPGTKYQLKRTKKRTFFIPGRSFALHERNNQMCKLMKSESD